MDGCIQVKNNVPGEGGDKEPRSQEAKLLSVAIVCILCLACRIMLDLEVEHKALSWGHLNGGR